MNDTGRMIQRPRRGRRLAAVFLVMIAVLAVLLILAPALLSGTTGGMISRAVEDGTGYRTEVDGVRLRWRGGQRVDRLRLHDVDGAVIADVRMRVDQGLLSLAMIAMGWSDDDLGPLHVSGEAQALLLRDGSFQPGRTARSTVPPVPPASRAPRDPGTSRAPAGAAPPAFAAIRGMPAVVIQLSELDVTLHLPDDDVSQTIVVRGLRGSVRGDEMGGGGRILIAIDSDDDRRSSRLQIAGSLEDFIGASGAFQPSTTAGDVQVTIDRLPVPYADDLPMVDRLSVRFATTSLTDRLLVEVHAHAADPAIEPGAESDGAVSERGERAPMRVRAAVTIHTPFDDSGALQASLQSVDGTLSATRLPLPLLQPFVSGTPILLREDVGLYADIEAVMASVADGGEDGHPDGLRRIVLQFGSEYVAAAFSGMVDDTGFITDAEGGIEWRPVGDAVERLSGGRARGVSVVRLDVEDLIVGRGTARVPDAGVVRLSVGGEFEARVPDGLYAAEAAAEAAAEEGPIWIPVRDLTVAARATVVHASAADGVNGAVDDGPGGAPSLEVRAMVDGLLVEVDAKLRSMPLSWPGGMRGADLRGMVRVSGTPGAALDGMLARTLDASQYALLHGTPLALSLTAEPGELDGADAWNVSLRGEAARSEVSADGSVVVNDEELRTGTVRTVVLIDDALSGSLFAGAQEDPDANGGGVRLARPTTVRADLDPVHVTGSWWTPGAWRSVSVSAGVMSDRVGVHLPGVQGIVDAEDVRAMIRGGVQDELIWADVDYQMAVSTDDRAAKLLNAVGTMRMSTLRGAVDGGEPGGVGGIPGGPQESAPTMAMEGEVTLSSLHVAHLERLFELDAQTMTGRLGNSGSVRASFSRPAGTSVLAAVLEPSLERLTGKVSAELHDDRIELSGGSLSWTLAKAYMQEWLDGTQSDDPSGMRMAGDARVDIALKRSVLPLAMLLGEAIDPAKAALIADFSLSDFMWTLKSEPEHRYELHNGALALSGPSLDRGIGVTIGGSIRERTTSVGALELAGRIRSLFTDGLFDSEAVTVTLNGSVSAVPSHVLDRLLEMDGFLTAAVGDALTATLAAQNLSRTRGLLDLDVQSPASRLTVRLISRENVLIIRPDHPLTGELELTPALRSRLLEKVHPIFADVRTTEQPLRVRSVDTLRIPTDGDPSRLHGRLEITVGNVEFDGGSTLLAIFSLFDRSDRVSRIPGSIAPIDVSIRNGVITYDRFLVKLDVLELAYRGQIDLVRQTADLRMEVPLAQVVHGLRELDGVADRISVPIVTRGPLRDLRTRIDPDFDIGKAALDAGIRRGIDELIRPGRSPIGGLLDDLLRRDRRPN